MNYNKITKRFNEQIGDMQIDESIMRDSDRHLNSMNAAFDRYFKKLPIEEQIELNELDKEHEKILNNALSEMTGWNDFCKGMDAIRSKYNKTQY